MKLINILFSPNKLRTDRMYACPLFGKQAVAWQRNVVAWKSSETINGDVRSGKVLPGCRLSGVRESCWIL